MSPTFARRVLAAPASIACVLASAAAFPALAQDDATALPGEQTAIIETDSGKQWRFTFGGGYTHRFESDLDEGGNISASTLSGGFNAATDVNDELTLMFRLNFGATDYEFGGGGDPGFGSLEPWNTVHSIAFGAVADYTFNDKWSLFGGPVLQFSRESGADWGDAFNFGVIAGATYFVHDHLAIGLGLGVTTQIEDSVRFFPIPIIEWGINDNLRISSRGLTGGRTSIELSGIELIWMTDSKAWEFALGAGSSYSRFRLDDDEGGAAPDGVGQDESTPVWLRASFRPNESFMIDAVAGMGFGAELTLDDEDGDKIADSDYDSPLFIGVFGSIKF